MSPLMIFGTLFLTHFYSDGFILYINGNGGFIGNYLDQTFLNSLIGINENISYYILILLVLILFLISINFNLKNLKNNKIKIGFLSNDFKTHPVSFFLKGLLLNLNKDNNILFLNHNKLNHN